MDTTSLIKEKIAAHKQKYPSFDDVGFSKWYNEKSVKRGWLYFNSHKSISVLNRSRRREQSLDRWIDSMVD